MKTGMEKYTVAFLTVATVAALTVPSYARGPVNGPKGPGDGTGPIAEGDGTCVPHPDGEQAPEWGALAAGNFFGMFIPMPNGEYWPKATLRPVTPRGGNLPLTWLEQFDADGDGVLTREEVLEARRAQLAEARARIEAIRTLREEMVAMFDADEDGVLSEEGRLAVFLYQLEVNEGFAAWIDERFDNDGEAGLSDEEALAAYELLAGVCTPQPRILPNGPREDRAGDAAPRGQESRRNRPATPPADPPCDDVEDTEDAA